MKQGSAERGYRPERQGEWKFAQNREWGGGEGRWEGSEGPKLLFQDWEGQKAASHRATAGQNISQDGGTAQTWQTVFGVEKGSDTVFFRGMSCE